jgi:predicted ATP-dependent protease
VDQYLADVRKELLENVDQLVPRDAAPAGLELLGGAPEQDWFTRFEVNLFVDNADTEGAPIVVEDHPTPSNLLGCIERESEMGALTTDFTLIKAGSLHRAHGGFLVLHVEDLLQSNLAWEGLLRALRSGRSKIEDPEDGQDQSRTKTIEPEPVDLRLKVVLIGTDDTYELLLAHEDRFPKLFKLKAHLKDWVQRKAGSIRHYLHSLARIIREAELLPFDREALAGLVDFSSRLAEDQKKLSLKLPLLREVMVEASALAAMDGRDRVDGERLRRAVLQREYRANLYEEEFLDEYDRELIKVATSGSSVGRVNGLSVTWFGDYEFGLPHQIACSVGAGEGGVVDLEREAELGGPIHTKAMMILKSYLLSQFAQERPLVFSGSLCFEQSYAGVEGDSASGAELAALLSALAGVPNRLSLAFTGAVSQSGAIMAVGGVTRKIEGFFEVCRRHGLSGEQGAIIPADVREHLMLRQEVVDAVAEGRFHIYPVRTIEEAMQLLTGMPAGRRGKNGRFPTGSLYRLVDNRLAELTAMARDHFPGLGRR